MALQHLTHNIMTYQTTHLCVCVVPPLLSFDATDAGAHIPIFSETTLCPLQGPLSGEDKVLHSGVGHICGMPGGAGSPIEETPPCDDAAHILESIAPKQLVDKDVRHAMWTGAPAQIEHGAEPETSGDEQEHVGSRDLR